MPAEDRCFGKRGRNQRAARLFLSPLTAAPQHRLSDSRDQGDEITLETAPTAAIVPALTDETPTQKIADPGGKYASIPKNPLDAAFDHIRGSFVQDEGKSVESRGEDAIQQGNQLVEWADKNGLRLDPETWLGKAVTGASEHDVWYDAGEYWKVTRPGHFGWTVIPGDNGLPKSAYATPIEYLSRWINANTYLGDRATLRGIAETGHGVQIIVSHPYIDGEYPEMEHVYSDMKIRGFVKVPDFVMGANAPSFYRKEDNVGIFDASEDNFIVSGGIPVPIDVITIRPGIVLKEQITNLIAGS